LQNLGYIVSFNAPKMFLPNFDYFIYLISPNAQKVELLTVELLN